MYEPDSSDHHKMERSIFHNETILQKRNSMNRKASLPHWMWLKSLSLVGSLNWLWAHVILTHIMYCKVIDLKWDDEAIFPNSVKRPWGRTVNHINVVYFLNSISPPLLVWPACGIDTIPAANKAFTRLKIRPSQPRAAIERCEPNGQQFSRQKSWMALMRTMDLPMISTVTGNCSVWFVMVEL